jgi:hypothetical protein
LKLKSILAATIVMLALAACGSPTDVETAANEAAATVQANIPAGAEQTAEAILSDPTVAAVANEAATMLADPGLQATLDQAFSAMNDQMTLTQGEALSFDALSGLGDISNYRMTVVSAPAGAGVTAGTVIKEASDGNLSLSPDEYGRYFTTAGDYRVRLDITSAGNQTASHEFTITVP